MTRFATILFVTTMAMGATAQTSKAQAERARTQARSIRASHCSSRGFLLEKVNDMIQDKVRSLRDAHARFWH